MDFLLPIHILAGSLALIFSAIAVSSAKGVLSSTLANKKISNSRLNVIDKQAYIKLMESLKLPNPAMVDVAVSANQACGNLPS